MLVPYRLSLAHALLAGGLLTLACLCSTPALAAKGSAKSREEAANKARKACLAGDVQTGMSILSDLFVSTKDPSWVYNQARCFEQNGRYEEAVTRFEEYLRLTKGSQDKDRGAAQEHLAECQSKLSKTAPPLAPPPEAAAPPPPPPQPVVQVSETQPTPARDGGGLRITGITVGAVGVAALAGGLTLNLVANKTAKDLNKQGGYDRDKASSQSTYQTLTWFGYGLGGACLVGGAVLYYLGSRGPGSSSVALLPSWAPGQAGMSLQGAF